MIRAGFIFLDTVQAPWDVNGYDAFMATWGHIHREPEWFVGLQEAGGTIYQRYAVSYFPGNAGTGSGGVPYSKLVDFIRRYDVWLRNPDGTFVTDGHGKRYFDMRASRGYARAIAKLGLLTFLPEMEKQTGFVPDGVFLDCVWDRGPYGAIWQVTEAERDDWQRGMGMWLAAIAFNLRRKRKEPLAIYVNGDTGQTHLIDGVCYENYPVHGDYEAIMARRGPAWARENELGCMVVPANKGDMCAPEAWAVASACLAFEACAGGAVVFDNTGKVFDVMAKLDTA